MRPTAALLGLLWIYGGVMYINCTRYIDGYTRDLSQLNKREQQLLKNSLAELRMAKIIHNDINKSKLSSKTFYMTDPSSTQTMVESHNNEIKYLKYFSKLIQDSFNIFKFESE